MLTDALRQPITTFAEAKAWIAELVARDLLFHFEDDPRQIICGLGGPRLFTDEEAAIVDDRVAELYAFEWGPDPREDCPIGYALDLTDPGWRTRP